MYEAKLFIRDTSVTPNTYTEVPAGDIVEGTWDVSPAGIVTKDTLNNTQCRLTASVVHDNLDTEELLFLKYRASVNNYGVKDIKVMVTVANRIWIKSIFRFPQAASGPGQTRRVWAPAGPPENEPPPPPGSPNNFFVSGTTGNPTQDDVRQTARGTWSVDMTQRMNIFTKQAGMTLYFGTDAHLLTISGFNAAGAFEVNDETGAITGAFRNLSENLDFERNTHSMVNIYMVQDLVDLADPAPFSGITNMYNNFYGHTILIKDSGDATVLAHELIHATGGIIEHVTYDTLTGTINNLKEVVGDRNAPNFDPVNPFNNPLNWNLMRGSVVFNGARINVWMTDTQVDLTRRRVRSKTPLVRLVD